MGRPLGKWTCVQLCVCACVYISVCVCVPALTSLLASLQPPHSDSLVTEGLTTSHALPINSPAPPQPQSPHSLSVLCFVSPSTLSLSPLAVSFYFTHLLFCFNLSPPHLVSGSSLSSVMLSASALLAVSVSMETPSGQEWLGGL